MKYLKTIVKYVLIVAIPHSATFAQSQPVVTTSLESQFKQSVAEFVAQTIAIQSSQEQREFLRERLSTTSQQLAEQLEELRASVKSDDLQSLFEVQKLTEHYAQLAQSEQDYSPEVLVKSYQQDIEHAAWPALAWALSILVAIMATFLIYH